MDFKPGGKRPLLLLSVSVKGRNRNPRAKHAMVRVDCDVGSHDPANAYKDSGSNMISRTSCAQRQAAAILAAQTSASAREETSMTENPPMTAFVSGTGPAVMVPSVATLVDCWR